MNHHQVPHVEWFVLSFSCVPVLLQFFACDFGVMELLALEPILVSFLEAIRRTPRVRG